MIVVFNFTLFISYVHLNKSEFRAKALHYYSGKIIELEYSLADLYKNNNNTEWHENNKEVEINGIFYEVIYTKIVGSKARIFVISDEDENRLFHEFARSKNNANHHFTEMFSFLFSLNYLDNFPTNEINNPEIFLKPVLSDFLFLDFHYYLKEIKPPRFSQF
mgnify:FL=1